MARLNDLAAAALGPVLKDCSDLIQGTSIHHPHIAFTALFRSEAAARQGATLLDDLLFDIRVTPRHGFWQLDGLANAEIAAAPIPLPQAA